MSSREKSESKNIKNDFPKKEERSKMDGIEIVHGMRGHCIECGKNNVDLIYSANPHSGVGFCMECTIKSLMTRNDECYKDIFLGALLTHLQSKYA
ncbi:MAG: hypothetical protein U9M90_02085 [Patescibacteria group bacterium]|nr:hypothetical protein [Patescibacteria group bacterium]